ncbi:MAG: SRPBCC family protein [bacterium]|nr:SRPBCC family protein [bacterium]
MAEHTHTVTTSVAADVVWDFVSDMDRWAPFLLGYQAHEKKSDSESIWTIKGDVGTLTRIVNFRVLITEWTEPERVRFTLEGIGEPMEGDGSFQLEMLGPSQTVIEAPSVEAPGAGFFVRFWAALVRRVLGRGRAERPGGAGAAGDTAAVRLTFRMGLTPKGTMAPMIDAMIKPVMVATAEDLAERIVLHLEDR